MPNSLGREGDLAGALAAGPWSADFSPELRNRLCARLRVREIRDGHVVFRAGDAPDGLYGVLA